MISVCLNQIVNPLQPGVAFLYPLKTENLKQGVNPLQPGVAFLYTPGKYRKTFRFSDVFRGYRKATPDCNGLSFLNIIKINVIVRLAELNIVQCSSHVETSQFT